MPGFLNPIPGKLALPVYNDSGEVIPPNAAMKISGRTSDGLYKVIKPDGDCIANVVFNSGSSIDLANNGLALNYFPCAGAYSLSGDANGIGPVAGETWGTKSGEWFLFKGRHGFECAQDGVSGVATWIRHQPSYSRVVKITTGTKINGVYDATIEVRDNISQTWVDDLPVWVIDLAGSSSLSALNQYDALFCGAEPNGDFYVSIVANNASFPLTATSKWAKVAGSITPSAWNSGTAYVVGNLVTSGGSTYICILDHINHAPPNATYWVQVTLASQGGYDVLTVYAVGDYVQKIRQLYSIESGGGGTTTSTTTTTTTSTTTTFPPCTGTCTYSWDNTTKVWTQTASSCSAGCDCQPPQYCGQFSCETTKTHCNHGAGPETPPCPGTTTTSTTTSTPCPTTTTTGSPLCADGCDYVWITAVGGWVLKSYGCDVLTCPCDFPGADGGECATTNMPCGAPPPPPPPPPPPTCTGSYRFYCNESNVWTFLDGSCVPSGVECPEQNCTADLPSNSCSCGAVVEMPCWFHCDSSTSTTPGPCDPTTSSTTTTVEPCEGSCVFMWDSVAGWVAVDTSGCDPCPCVPPSYDGTTDCETAQTGCGGTTTTTTTTTTTSTSTTTTTTTTAAPCTVNLSTFASTSTTSGLVSCTTCTGGTYPGDTIVLDSTGIMIDGDCSDCANANGTFDLVNAGSCSWYSDFFTVCGAATARWHVLFSSGGVFGSGTWVVILESDVSITGKIATFMLDTSGDCTLPVNVPLSEQLTYCYGCSIPTTTTTTTTSTTTTTPAPCCNTGTDPGDSITLSVTLANGTCTDCANASGAFTLNAVTPGCVWRSDPFDLCSESGCYWTASMVSDRYWVIVLTTPSAGSIMSYLLDVLGDCSLPVVVPRNSQSGECVGSLTARLA